MHGRPGNAGKRRCIPRHPRRGRGATRIRDCRACASARGADCAAARLARSPGAGCGRTGYGNGHFPDARLKVFLTASVEQRAQRRYRQLIDKGFAANIFRLLRDLTERDARDSARAVAPLVPAAEAKTLDTSCLSAGQAVDAIVEWWRAASGES